MEQQEIIKARCARVAEPLDERTRRAVAASEALAIGWGGITAVSRATGLSRTVIHTGIKELTGRRPRAAAGRIRRPGGGRKQTVETDRSVRRDLDQRVLPVRRGDPESALGWTGTRVRTLAAQWPQRGHPVSHQWVAERLRDLGESLQGHRQRREGREHPDRDAPFGPITATAQALLAAGDPVSSVDTKKQDLVGDFKNAGGEWRPQGEPEEGRVSAFVLPQLGRVSPYGVDDLASHAGWVNVGIDHDTAAFAVERIRRGWQRAGKQRDRQAQRVLITADGGESLGSGVRLGKWALQRLANETGRSISVCHFPPGTRTWNKGEHRLFAFSSQTWRGKPLVSYAVILNLIAATTTATGLTVESVLDTQTYPAGITVTDQEMATIQLVRGAFHGEWNSTISPHAS